jgi:hypothetical protein
VFFLRNVAVLQGELRATARQNAVTDMKAHLATVALLVLALSAVVLTCQTRHAFSSVSSIIMQSPTDNETFLSGTIYVKFTINQSQLHTSSTNIAILVECLVDGAASHTWNPPLGSADYTITLFNIAQGSHSLEVKVTGLHVYSYTKPDGSQGFVSERPVLGSSGLIHFNVGPPELSDFSIQNQTYNTNQIPLSFNIDKEPGWQLGYILDQETKTPLVRNTTLSLPEGSHSIAIYLADWQGNSVQYSAVFFTVVPPVSSPSPTPSSRPSPTPALSLIPSPTQQPTAEQGSTPKPNYYSDWIPYAIIALVILTVVGVLVYFKKSKRT